MTPINLYLLNTVDSTMNIAKAVAKEGNYAGLVPTQIQASMDLRNIFNPFAILAREQTSGRGRIEREWVSKKGLGLYTTLVFTFKKSKEEVSGFSLIVGVSIKRALTKLGLDIGLKWPNDIVCFGFKGELCKLGGVLIELISGLSGQCISTGIGINIKPVEIPSGLKTISLQELGVSIEYQDLFSLISEEFWQISDEFLGKGFKAFKQEWWDSFILKDRDILLLNNGVEISGRPVEVLDDGSLRIETSSGQMITYVAGDVSLRPR